MQCRATAAGSGRFAWKDVVPLLIMGLFVFIVSTTHSESIFAYASANRQRIAMVAFVEEADILSVLSSVKHLRPQLMNRYEHDWIFVSREPVSQNFLSLTGSATGSVCRQELLSDQHQKIELIRMGNSNTWTNGQPQPVAMIIINESQPRLSAIRNDYDLYVLLEPKAVHSGYHEQHVLPIYLMKCPALVSRFGDNNQYHKTEALQDDISTAQPRISTSDRVPLPHQPQDELSKTFGNHDTQNSALKYVMSDLTHLLNTTRQASDIGSRVRHWLKSTGSPTTFLRRKGNTLQISDDPRSIRLGEDFENNSDSLLVPTISQQLLQPRKSVWSRLRKRDFKYVTRPSAAEPTTTIKASVHYSLMAMEKHHIKIRLISDYLDGAMMNQYDFWELVAADFSRQQGIPGLRSGNTVIDERNFAML